MLLFLLALALAACSAIPPLFDMVPLGERETLFPPTMVAPLEVDTGSSKGSSTHKSVSSLRLNMTQWLPSGMAHPKWFDALAANQLRAELVRQLTHDPTAQS